MKPPNKIASLRDALSDDEFKKLKHSTETDTVTTDWVFIAEWIRLTGLAGYMAYKEEKISFHEMIMIIKANEVIEERNVYNIAKASFIGAVSSRTKSPHNTFNKLTQNIIKRTKVND